MHAGETSEAHRSAVREAVDRYAGPLSLYARRLLGGRDPEAAGEVVQDVFLRLCELNGARYREIDGRLRPWLYTVCRNLALDRLRQERRMSPLTDERQADAASAMAAPPEQLAQREDESRAVRELGALPGPQQEAIRLKFQHGLSYKEIAAVTGKTTGNVGFLISTGLKTIRQRLAAEM